MPLNNLITESKTEQIEAIKLNTLTESRAAEFKTDQTNQISAQLSEQMPQSEVEEIGRGVLNIYQYAMEHLTDEKGYNKKDWQQIKLDCDILLHCCITYRSNSVMKREELLNELLHEFGGNMYHVNSVLMLADSLRNRDIQVPPRLIRYQQALEFAIKQYENKIIAVDTAETTADNTKTTETIADNTAETTKTTTTDATASNAVDI